MIGWGDNLTNLQKQQKKAKAVEEKIATISALRGLYKKIKTAASDHSETAEILSDILSPTATYLLYDTLCVSPIFFRYQRLIVALI